MTRTTRHTTTIQLWSGGATYEYRGDLHGPANQRSLRGGHDTQNLWRKGDPAEWRAIRIETVAERYVAHEILVCDSSLVDALIQVASDGSMSRNDATRALGRAFDYDRIENLYLYPTAWSADDCREYLREQGEDVPGSVDETGAAIDLVELRKICLDHAQDHPAEVFEWWRVSEWLCKELRAINQVVIDNDYGCWWGRCTTGQSMIMDGVLQQVAARYETEDR